MKSILKKWQAALNIDNIAKALIVFSYSLIVGCLILLLSPNYFQIILIVFVPIIFLFLINKPFILLSILLLILPFSSVRVFDVQIVGVPGLKLINILFAIRLISFMP